MTDTYTLKLNDGRTLAYACYGRAEGKPLYFIHGFPGSRYQAALIHEQSKSAGVYVVAPERPGFGKRHCCRSGKLPIGQTICVSLLMHSGMQDLACSALPAVDLMLWHAPTAFRHG